MHKALNTILLVEDDRASRNLIRAIFRYRGFRIVEAESIKEARDYLRRDMPSIILLDIRLKDGSGLDLVTELRANPVFNNLPIVAITAQALRGDREAILASGVDHYFSKPIDTHQLRDLVDQLSRKGRGVVG